MHEIRMEPLQKGRLCARLAETAGDVARAQALRHAAFFGRPGQDADAFDSACAHMLIEDASGTLLACYRLLALPAQAIGQSYSAQFYDLTRLSAYPGPCLELGRFCAQPGLLDPDLLRLAFGAMARVVDAGAVALLFGCASFAGADPDRHWAALTHLRSGHLGPEAWRPGPRASEVVDLPQGMPERRQALTALPPLLRLYLGIGGWVSDHAVIDRAMDTLHVFTAVEIAAIPPARQGLLRVVAQP